MLNNNDYLRMKDIRDVAYYFMGSDDPMVREIGRNLAPAATHHPAHADYHIPDDLTAVLLHANTICTPDGKFQRGANATIAQAIFGDRSKTGGSYNARIQDVKKRMGDLYSRVWGNATTTTEPEPEPTDNAVFVNERMVA